MDILKNAYNRNDFKTLINSIFKKSGIFLDYPYEQEISSKDSEKIQNGYLLGELELNGDEFAIFEYQVKDA